jgi:hypothetical protein
LQNNNDLVLVFMVTPHQEGLEPFHEEKSELQKKVAGEFLCHI